MKKGVLDASSAILLFKVNLFQELLDTYQIFLTDSVFIELTKDGYPGTQTFKASQARNRITVLPAQEFHRVGK